MSAKTSGNQGLERSEQQREEKSRRLTIESLERRRHESERHPISRTMKKSLIEKKEEHVLG